MALQFDTLNNWFNGVITSASSDVDGLPPNASPRGLNTYLSNIGEQTALIGTRPGSLTLNSTPITGSPGIFGFQYKKASGTKYNLLVSSTGRLDTLNTDGTTSALATAAFTAGTYVPIFAVANDLCFICNGHDQKKTDGASVYNFGIVAPTPPTVTPTTGGAQGMSGFYDVALTYYNSNTGAESSLSSFTTTTSIASNDVLDVSWAAPTDPQVTHVRVYIRKQSLSGSVLRLITGTSPAPDGTTGGFPIVTTATTVDISDTTIDELTILAPTTTENNPPPAAAQYPVWHLSRLFLADSGNIYYSSIKNNTPYPESFDPLNALPIGPNDGDTIVALWSYSGSLYIFKRFSIWVLEGNDPNSWVPQRISDTIGCSSMSSIVEVEGVLYWWAGQNGPVAMEYAPYTLYQPKTIGRELLFDSIAPTVLNQEAFALVAAGVDEETETILWAVPDITQATRNTVVIPFSYRAERFHASQWTPYDINSLWAVEVTGHLKSLYIGNYAGQVFQWNAATNDGVPAGTTTHGTVTSATTNTLTDASASFATTGGGLIERYVYAVSQDGLTLQRARITANTATQLTINGTWSATPDTTWTYVVGGIDVELDTPWVVAPSPSLKKKLEFIFTEAVTTAASMTLTIDIFTSLNETEPKKTKTMTLLGGGPLYDASTSLYGTSVYGATTMTHGKTRMGVTGTSWKLRYRSIAADEPFVLWKVNVKSHVLGWNR